MAVYLNKYWRVLDSLKYPSSEGLKSMATEKDRLEYNTLELQNFINIPAADLAMSISKKWKLDNLLKSSDEILWNDLGIKYNLYGLHLLNEIVQQVNFQSFVKEDLISERHKALLICCLKDLSHLGLEQNLLKEFYKGINNTLFHKEYTNEVNYTVLEVLLHGYTPILAIQPLHAGKALDDVVLHYMAGVFSLLITRNTREYTMSQESYVMMNSYLQNMWDILPKTQYIRNVMLIRSNSNIGQVAQKILQRQLQLRLCSPGGFQALTSALSSANKNEERNVAELIARLVAQPAYSTKAQENLLKQILTFFQTNIINNELGDYTGVALLSLRYLYELNENNRSHIKVWLYKQFEPLVNPQECSVEIMEWQEVLNLISLVYHAFCTSTIECLHSELLISLLCLLLKFLYIIHSCDNEKMLQDQLKSIIIRCLDNRSDSEFESILRYLVVEKYPIEWSVLHEKIVVKRNVLNGQELKLILSHEAIEFWEPLSVLIDVLINSTYYLLTFKVFLAIFRLLPNFIEEKPTSDTISNNILLHTEEDVVNILTNKINKKFQTKLRLINALKKLIEYPPLKPFISDNLGEFLVCLVSCLNCISKSDDTSIAIIVLILIKEIIENFSNKIDEYKTTLEKPLIKLQATEDHIIKNQITTILQKLQSKNAPPVENISSTNEFEIARSLVESKESYLQVEGIDKFINLIKSRDENTISNGHIIIALGLAHLKSQESYTFLNSVRLFVALVYVMEAEVLQLLSDEYLNNYSSADYRLIVGEAILKVCGELGPLCYKYKGILLNCFMSGCRSPLNEFRFSSFSNLGHLCKILIYQVDQFFQELLHIIDCELSTGQYIPAKRASVAVLSDLLEGMDNLLDHQNLLLPIYRLLKYLALLPGIDEKIRMHAINGLSCLSVKCKELFKTLNNPVLQKEIKIVSTKDICSKSHILELN